MSASVSKAPAAVSSAVTDYSSTSRIPARYLKSSSSSGYSDAAVVSLSKGISVHKLEKHLSDYKRGKGYLSTRTGSDIAALHRQNGSELGQIDPAGSKQYLSYSTAFSYEKKARFANSINTMTEHRKRIREVSDQEFSKMVSELVAKYDGISQK